MWKVHRLQSQVPRGTGGRGEHEWDPSVPNRYPLSSTFSTCVQLLSDLEDYKDLSSVCVFGGY